LDVQLGTFIQKQAILMKDEFNVFVIYVQGVPDLSKKFEFVENTENGIRERIVYFKQSQSALRKVTNARRYKLAQILAFKNVDFKPDLCHVHVPYRSAFLALDLRKKGVPFVITEHWSGHINGEYDKKNAADITIYKQVLGKAKGISVVSELLQRKFKENTSFDSIVIPNLIEEQIDTSTNVREDRIEILTVSDLVDDTKNVTGLISAFKNANETHENLHLTIIGGGPDEALIKALVKDLGLQNHITFRGRLEHDEVISAYHNYDFYICNSNFETFGMTVAEALLAGKPVISTKCGGPEEYVNSKNGILIETKDNKALSAAILDMVGEYKNYSSSELSNEIRTKFGAEKIKSQIKEFYLNAIND
jgi:L-malate glycosyltransferase